MGIVGLTGAVRRYRVKRDNSFFLGSDIYVDALNFSYFVNDIIFPEIQKQDSSKSIYDIYSVKFYEYVSRIITGFEPNSVTFVYDAFIGKEKLEVRLERKRAKLYRDGFRNVANCLTRTIAEHFPEVKVLYSGSEAEDYIMDSISRKQHCHRYQFVISNDSDFYRYAINNKNNVYIVPITEGIGKWTETIHLPQAIQRVDRDLIIHTPIEIEGETYVASGCYKRALYELINCCKYFNELFITLDQIICSMDIPAAYNAYPFYDCGSLFRQMFYGMIWEQHFNTKKELLEAKVTEWQQVGTSLKSCENDIMTGEELKLTSEKLKKMEVTDIFQEYFVLYIKDHELDEHITRKIISRVEGIVARNTSKRATSTSKNYNQDQLVLQYCLARGFIISLKYLNMILPISNDIERIELDFSIKGVMDAVAIDLDASLGGLSLSI